MKENSFILKKKGKKQAIHHTNYYGPDYANDIALRTNAHTQAEFLLYCLEQAAGGIGLHANADKTEYMCFNHKGDTSTLSGGSLKFVDKFIFLGSSVSSTEMASVYD